MPSSDSTASGRRLDYLDWLRIIAVALLLPYHTARVFDVFNTFYIKNAVLSDQLSAIVAFLDLWQMPILFVLAGAATSLALTKRSGSQYLVERMRRLVLPFVFGLLVIVPPQAYLARMTHSDYTGSFFQFYPTFLQIQPNDLSGYYGTFTPGHLWFILFLAVFSIVALPLFLGLRSKRGVAILARVSGSARDAGWILGPVLLLGLTGLLPDLGGKNPFYYILLFIGGYLVIADTRLMSVIERRPRWTLALALSAGAGILATIAFGVTPAKFSAMDIGLWIARCGTAWWGSLALIAMARRHLNVSGPVLRYAREASYPVYILHQTVIVVIAYFVVAWPAGMTMKYLAILIAASAGTLLIYEFLIRRLNLLRFLFGMKPISKSQPDRVQLRPAA